MRIFKTFYLLPILLAIACGSMGVRTDAHSFKDPVCGTKNIRKILVYANVKDMQYRDVIESKIVNYFVKWNYNCVAVRSIDIVMPTRTYSTQELQKLFKENSIDAILTFTVTNLGYTQHQMTIDQPYQTYGNVYKGGSNYYYYNSQTYGGPQTYNFSKPYLDATADLFDPDTGNKLWTVALNSYGNAFANIDDALNDAMKTLVLKLEKDGVVKAHK